MRLCRRLRLAVRRQKRSIVKRYFELCSKPDPIDVTAVIERIFRYIEMTFLVALISFLYTTIGPPPIVLMLILSVLAGLYLAIPLVQWLKVKPAPDRQARVVRTIMVITLGTLPFQFTLGISTLVSATFQIDGEKARRAYADYERGQMFMSCAHAHLPLEQCEKEGNSVIYLKGKAYPPEPEPAAVVTKAVAPAEKPPARPVKGPANAH